MNLTRIPNLAAAQPGPAARLRSSGLRFAIYDSGASHAFRVAWPLAIGYWPFRAISADGIPPLAPALPVVPPTFWEQHGWVVLLTALAAVSLLALGLWLALRPRPVPPVPPETRVRAELEELRLQPETGAVLSRVSQSLRRYLVAAFALPPEELNTTEFCARLRTSETVGAELAGAVSQFLREGDERKFSPAPPAVSLGAARRALDLVTLAEARRERQRGAGVPPVPYPAGKTPAPPA